MERCLGILVVANMDYLEQNSFRNYPFKDNCLLQNLDRREEKDILPSDYFLDFQLVSKKQQIVRAALGYFRNSVSDNKLYLNLLLLPFSNSDALELKFNVTKPANKYDVLSYSDNDYCIKFIIGETLRLNTNNFTYTFCSLSNLSNAEFCTSTIINHVSQVTEINFKNYNDSLVHKYNMQAVAIDAGVNIATLGLRYNTTAERIDSQSTYLDVVPGSGKGLYNDCETEDPQNPRLKSINKVGADQYGNLNITGDICHKINSYGKIGDPTIKQLYVYYPCKETACNGNESRALAYYINRIRNGLVEVAKYANIQVNNLQSTINTYQAAQSALRRTVAPYIEVTYNITKSNTKKYYSFQIGIFEPNQSKMNFTLISKPLASNTSYVGVTNSIGVIDGSQLGWIHPYLGTTLREENKEYTIHPTLSSPGGIYYLTYFTDRSLNCRSTTQLNTVMSIPEDKINSSIEWFLEQTGVSYPCTAYTYLDILPSTVTSVKYFYIKLNAKRLYDNSRYYYTVNVEFYYNFSIATTPIAQVTFSCGLSDFQNDCVYTTKSGIFSNNGVVTSDLANSDSLVSGASVTFPNRVSLQFGVNMPSTSTNAKFTLNCAITRSGESSPDSRAYSFDFK